MGEHGRRATTESSGTECSWPLAACMLLLTGIIIQDVLGYEVSFARNGGSLLSPGRLSGCPEAFQSSAFEGCPPEERGVPESMINLEFWNNNDQDRLQNLENAAKAGLAYSSGWTGFVASNALYVDSQLVADAWDSAGEVAEHYRGWQSNFTVAQVPGLGLNSTWNEWGREACEGEDCADSDGIFMPPMCLEAPHECATMLAVWPYYARNVLEQMVTNLGMKVGVQWLGEHVKVLTCFQLQCQAPFHRSPSAERMV